MSSSVVVEFFNAPLKRILGKSFIAADHNMSMSNYYRLKNRDQSVKNKDTLSYIAQGIFVSIWPNLELREDTQIFSPSCSI